ncbi:hypothetical protein MN608_00862 [Microdochium nivale]|nr:hypothetical protein MN608_00862 [Microdochium nivale]
MTAMDATTRLRRTFAYPSDNDTTDPTDDDDDSRAALDEQEQEDLIQILAEQNEARNAQFATVLLALPLLATLPYLVVLGVRASSVSDRLIALLSVSSLASTAYMLWTLAPGVTGIWYLDAWTAGVYSLSSSSASKSKANKSAVSSSSSAPAFFDPSPDRDAEHITASQYAAPAPIASASTSMGPDYAAMGGLGIAARRKRRRSSASSFAVWFPSQKTPLELYLPYLNAGLSIALVLMSAARSFSSSKGSSLSWGDFGLGNLPAIVYAVVLLAKVVMGSVDPEKELSALRYQYMGA